MSPAPFIAEVGLCELVFALVTCGRSLSFTQTIRSSTEQRSHRKAGKHPPGELLYYRFCYYSGVARPTRQKTNAIEKRTVALGDDRRAGQTLEGRRAMWGSRVREGGAIRRQGVEETGPEPYCGLCRKRGARQGE